MSLQPTKHASVRMQQRGIPPLIVEWLRTFGVSRHDHRGAEILYFDKHSRKALAKVVGEEIVSRLAGLLDTYAVIADDGMVITAGHRYRRIARH